MAKRSDLQRNKKIYSFARVAPKFAASADEDYAKDLMNNIDWKQSVKFASTVDVPDLTANPMSIDGYVLSPGDRVLLKEQTNATENGIYSYGALGLERAEDAIQDKLTCGAACFVESGGTYMGTMWYLETNDPITVDTTPLSWRQFFPDTRFFVSAYSNAIYTTSSVAIRGQESSIIKSIDKGADVFFYVSGSMGAKEGDGYGTSLFGGDVIVSGSAYINANRLEVTGTVIVEGGITGSLTKLSDGTDYIKGTGAAQVTTSSKGGINIYVPLGGGGGGGSAAGSDTYVQFNDMGAFGANSNFTFNQSTLVLTTPDLLPVADVAHNLGSPSLRWANIYTGDLHLKNDRGNWTIIEEEEFLTVRNNKTGKLYKFCMEQIEEPAEGLEEKTSGNGE